MIDEGYIKFNLEWDEQTAPDSWQQDLADLIEARQILFDAGLIGILPDGIGYGNVSKRAAGKNNFWISGTQTGGINLLRPDHFALVDSYEISKNKIHCTGPIKASSESMTHAALYEVDSAINYVLHIHKRSAWDLMLNKIPSTGASIAYGTPEIAGEVMRIKKQAFEQSFGLIAMGGHEEGLIAFGDKLSNALQALKHPELLP